MLEAFTEAIGRSVGGVLAPAVAVISHWRGGRALHPDGVTYVARITPVRGAGLRALGSRLEGPAIVRFSGCLWRSERRWPELLGVAVRCRRRESVESDRVEPGDQDLLFATVSSAFRLPLALFSTRAEDYLANYYWALMPFHAEGIGRVWLRLAPASPHVVEDGARETKLEKAVRGGRARLQLQARRRAADRWTPIATLDIVRRSTIDQDRLRFDPFVAGRRIHPAGLLAGVRAVVYPASQSARRSAVRADELRERP